MKVISENIYIVQERKQYSLIKLRSASARSTSNMIDSELNVQYKTSSMSVTFLSQDDHRKKQLWGPCWHLYIFFGNTSRIGTTVMKIISTHHLTTIVPSAALYHLTSIVPASNHCTIRIIVPTSNLCIPSIDHWFNFESLNHIPITVYARCD